MSIKQLQQDWERFGAGDPMWAVVTDGTDSPGRWSPTAFFALGRTDVERWIARLCEVGGATSGSAALDFGCGVGRLTQALADHFDTVIGVDVSRSMLAAAAQHNRRPDAVRFVHNARDDLSAFGPASFDLVLSHIVLQHLPPKLALRYIAEFLRIVRPGGSLVFQIPTERVRRRWRYTVIRTLPSLVSLYRRLRHGPSPHMEMNAIPHRVIDQTVRLAGGRIVAADPDHSAGPEFRSAMYYVLKQPDQV